MSRKQVFHISQAFTFLHSDMIKSLHQAERWLSGCRPLLLESDHPSSIPRSYRWKESSVYFFLWFYQMFQVCNIFFCYLFNQDMFTCQARLLWFYTYSALAVDHQHGDNNQIYTAPRILIVFCLSEGYKFAYFYMLPNYHMSSFLFYIYHVSMIFKRFVWDKALCSFDCPKTPYVDQTLGYAYLWLLNARIKDMHHHCSTKKYFKIFF